MSVHIDIACEGCEGLAVPDDELSRVVDLVLSAEGVTRPCELSLSVVDEATMRTLNRSWRGVDAPTDVLSLECERPFDADLGEGEPCELGDVVLAPEVLARQAARFTTTPANETRLMLIHAVLHLLGYDHLNESDARAMEAREDELLALVCESEPAHVELTRHAGEHTEGHQAPRAAARL